jgi:cation:H+ antiporter
MVLRLAGTHPPPVIAMGLFGASILGAGFLLSWGAEAAEAHVAQGVALAGLALITVLPEFASTSTTPSGQEQSLARITSSSRRPT